ncbi:MAG: hypothetical protein QNJ47_25805 [Nostocaceae cyanobacterium]|nr:hypothetical protein [Nostocaceae cyanobacterium]
MNSSTIEIKQIAAQLLAGMLANPHIYPMISDEMARGQKEQDLMVLAVEMAEGLIDKVEKQVVDKNN